MEDRSQVIFVNGVAVSGFNNGVTNLAFSTASYVPGTDAAGNPCVDVKEFISANLRMDLFCVQQVHDTLGKILEEQTKPPKKSEVN